MLRKIVFSAVILSVLFLVTSCHEGYVSSEGETLKQYLEPESLKALVEKPKDDIWIIDVRPESAYKKGHIPGAKSFPSSTVMDRLDELPKDKYLIFYCETGGRAQMVIKKLEEKGYTKMMNWGGNGRWKWDREK
ncbi:rhodanese-like domain-containing protein [bacterium]|nr:rhodanese-like domain-containing protein [bacterium]